MDNKVGTDVPSAEEIQELLEQTLAISAALEKYTIKLTPEDRRYLAPFLPGGEPVVQLVGDLAEKYGVVLPDMPVDGMRADLTLAQRLAPLVSQFALVLSRLEDTTAQGRSEAWQAATGNYSVLVRVSAANPSLAKELEPARAFFARKRRKPVAGEGPGEALKKP